MLQRKISDLTPSNEPAKRVSSGTVLPIFGQNLRILTGQRGTQAKVCGDLDIGRIQFQRYLRGESFPKPHVLKRICDYFEVNARILTEPLTDELMGEMAARPQIADFVARNAWLAAIGFATSDQNYFEQSAELEDGLYVMWQWCAARKNTILRKLFRISREDGATVLRGYAPREFFPPRTALREREYRGICLNLNGQGYVFLTFFAQPSQMIAMAYVKPTQFSEHSGGTLVGFHAITRDELPDMPRLSRVVIERQQTTGSALVRAAHAPSFYTLADLPAAIADLLSAPVA